MKARKFWDPVEKKVIISSHAIFDERCFPGNSTVAINLIPASNLPNLPNLPSEPSNPEEVLHQGEDEEHDDEAPVAPVQPVPDEPAPVPVLPAPAVVDPVPVIPANAPPPFRHQNPPRTGRYHGSLRESSLERRNLPLPPPPPSSTPTPAPSIPDSLNLQTPPPQPALPLPPLIPALMRQLPQSKLVWSILQLVRCITSFQWMKQ